MSADVAVDGGQSGLRVGLVDRGSIVRVVGADGFSYRPAADAVSEDAQVLIAAVKSLGVQVGRLVLGLTNAPAAAGERQRLADAVRIGVDARQVGLTSDMVTAHSGALAGADGVVVSAGTGAVCFGVIGEHRVRSDGFGYLLGDEGSGFAVGRAGLRAALRAGEGRGPQTTLVASMGRAFAHVPDFPHGLYRRPHPVEEIAGFAREVARAADEGDRVARVIWSRAVDGLVNSVASVIERCHASSSGSGVPLSYTGGLFTVIDHVLTPFVNRLARVCPAAAVQAPAGDALAGAARLLDEGAERYGELVTHSTGAGR